MLIIQALEQKWVGLRILNLGMDTQTPTGKLMLTVLGRVAQFEREGTAKSKADGKCKGRKPITADWRQKVVRLATEGMTETTVYHVLAAARRQTAMA
jgi:DNA invertase Pin-like site-specific DNA recombinase